jgi:PH (Pleckstrin Homology) domain-containing protein/zinc ribbon protein
MALINCPECGKPVSASAHACPVCGYPVAEKMAQHPESAEVASAGAEAVPGGQGQALAEVRPSWWGYFWYLFFFWLIVPPIIAYFRRASTVLRIFPERITLERGIISKCYRDYNPRDIRSIDVDQSFFQRMVGIGDLTMSTAATVEASEEMTSISDPKGVRDLILAQRGAR